MNSFTYLNIHLMNLDQINEFMYLIFVSFKPIKMKNKVVVTLQLEM